MSMEDLKRVADELDEQLQFVHAYMNRKLSPEIMEAIKEAQAGGGAKTLGGALDIAKKTGWKPEG